ncbi:MAG: hypothetical protein VKJ46_11960 [Leptolyngbyaceae bacterium]|nr:hypothetical protein [Leptolyngbyaceae bacterium]
MDRKFIVPNTVTPNPVTFEEAIALTQSLLARMEHNDLSEVEVEAAIAALVHTENGARGFFVTYLTDTRPLADQPSMAVVQALRTAPTVVAELLVKNLAMSTAMAMHHRRNQDAAMAASSDQVRLRTANLIQLVQLPEVQDRGQQLRESAVTGTGDYAAFLTRWGYDEEQRQAIRDVLTQVIPW